MQGIYTETQICLDDVADICKRNGLLWAKTSFQYPQFTSEEITDLKKNEHARDRICLYGEPEMEQIMTGIENYIKH